LLCDGLFIVDQHLRVGLLDLLLDVVVGLLVHLPADFVADPFELLVALNLGLVLRFDNLDRLVNLQLFGVGLRDAFVSLFELLLELFFLGHNAEIKFSAFAFGDQMGRNVLEYYLRPGG